MRSDRTDDAHLPAVHGSRGVPDPGRRTARWVDRLEGMDVLVRKDGAHRNWILKDKSREENLLLGDLLEEDSKEIIDEAMYLARSPEAAGMPGYPGSNYHL